MPVTPKTKHVNGQVKLPFIGSKHRTDWFGPGSNFEKRYIPDHEVLAARITAIRGAFPDVSVVLVMGGYDIKHVGHDRYLERAKEAGDLVVVGVDSDAKIRSRKGVNRPVVPETERLEQLCHLRHVDLVTIKNGTEPRWHLIRLLHPDVLIATKETYTPEEIEELEREYCGQVLVHEPQAETSTTARIRLLLLDLSARTEEALDTITARFNAMVDETKQSLRGFLDKGAQ